MKGKRLFRDGFSKKPIGRRAFLKKLSGLVGGIALAGGIPFPWRRAFALTQKNGTVGARPSRLIFVAVDGLHPQYIELNARGMPGGREGDWLTPNLRAFLKKSLWYKNAKAYLPAATDMNHLNALAGTCSAQTGILGVWAQPRRWSPKGEAVVTRNNIADARDDRGRPVDTLFHAWKRRYPESKTTMISGKEWVAEMFREEGGSSPVDILVTGPHHPDYLMPPRREKLADPATDDDAACDPESGRGSFFGKSMNPGEVMTRLYTGQGGLLTWQMEHFADRFPHDQWVVEAALEIFKRENPGMAYILLAQCDDAGHCLGSAWDPSEFVPADPPYTPPLGCENKPGYQLVSSRNRMLFREAVLDVIRDVDIQFGRLMEGFRQQGVLDDAIVILLSDHSMVNHLDTDDFSSTDCIGVLQRAGIIETRHFLENRDVFAFTVSSYGLLYWKRDKQNVARAKAALLDHRAFNPQSGVQECPWWVIDREDMKNGLKGVCLPGELYHDYYVEVDRERTVLWPDLIILAKNGWQLPVYNGQVPNVGIKAPRWTPPWRVYNGGHGSVDTLPIVAAVRVPNGKTGVCEEPLRIADLGVTAAALFDLELQSSTVGKNLSKDII